MARMKTGLVAVVTMALMLGPSPARAQTKPAPYRPLTNGQMSELGIWHQWVTAFNEMTPKQRAEVVRRHIKMCLDSFELTDEQRAFVTNATATFVTEAAYDTTDPEKRAAVQRDVQPVQEKAMSLLGRDLMVTFFFAKPPISVLEAVKNDPAFKKLRAGAGTRLWPELDPGASDLLALRSSATFARAARLSAFSPGHRLTSACRRRRPARP